VNTVAQVSRIIECGNNMPIRVIVLVSDPFLHLLEPFAYLFNTYWSSMQPVLAAGYTKPDFGLPPNFEWHTIDLPPYPKEKYSDGMIKLLNGIPDQHLVLMLEDYLLCRTADSRGVNTLAEYMRDHRDVLRMDLHTDRMYAGDAKDIGAYGHYDLVETPDTSPYQFSFQTAIWNKSLMLRLLKPNLTPWQIEIQTKPPAEMRVLGTRQHPVKYANAMLKGKLQEDEIAKIPKPHRDRIRGWLK